MTKILLLNQAFYPDSAATAQYLFDLAKELVNKGFTVTALASSRGYNDPDEVYARRETVEAIRVIRVQLPRFRTRTLIVRIEETVLLNLGFAWKLIQGERQDVIVVLTSPPLIAWLACIIGRLRGSRVVYWVMDINPEQAIRAGWIARGSTTARILESALSFVLASADRVIVLDRFMRETLTRVSGRPDRLTVVPLWANFDELLPVPREDNPFRAQHGLEGAFVVMYSGNLSMCHPVATLLDAAEKLAGHINIRFVFVGGGARLCEVSERIKKSGLDNVLCLPLEKRELISSSLSAADVHVVSMGDPYVGIVHPSKVYGILAVGRPFIVLGPEVSAPAELARLYSAGWIVPHGDSDKVAEIILAHRDTPLAERARIGVQIRSRSAELGRDRIVGELVRLIAETVPRRALESSSRPSPPA